MILEILEEIRFKIFPNIVLANIVILKLVTQISELEVLICEQYGRWLASPVRDTV